MPLPDRSAKDCWQTSEGTGRILSYTSQRPGPAEILTLDIGTPEPMK